MFFAGLKDDQLKSNGMEITVYEKGNYVVEVKAIEHKVSKNTNLDYILVKYSPIAKIETIEGVTLATKVSGSLIFVNYILLTRDGNVNDVAEQQFAQLLSAATNITTVEELAEEYGAETIQETAEKASAIVTISVLAYIGQRTEKDWQDTTKTVIKNTVSSFKPLTDVEKDAMSDSNIDVTPF